MVFHWSLSDSKSPQVSRTLLSILAVVNNAVVWMVSTRPPTSKSSSPFSNPLVTVPNAPITIGIIVICMFHNFFSSLARSRYLSFFSHSFSFILWSAGTEKSTILQVLFFFFFLLLIIIKSGLLAGIRWSVCILKSHRSLCESFSRTGDGLCIYHLLVWSNYYYYYYYYYLLLESFSHQFYLIVAQWSLRDSKSPLLSILAVLNNTLVWMVYSRPVISKSSSPFNNPFVTVPSCYY